MSSTPKFAIFLLLTATLFAPVIPAAEMTWPLRATIDISNGFGDYRDGRFHTGVDLRTGGQVGLPVYSPVDGYVRRLKVSYVGYGKGLYIQGTDGYLYVFGHLQTYAPAVDTVVKRAQYAAERYFIDLTLPADSLRIKKGALVAYSGETGAGAPHLHFEKRLTDENPLNPLSHGFKIADKVSPTISRIGFQQTDDHSLFENGRRKWFLPVNPGRGKGKYHLDNLPYFDAPFGILLDGYDRTRPEGMKQAISLLQLEVDGQLIYESRFDTLAFSTSKSVYFVYDYDEAGNGDKSVRRLFHMASNQFAGNRGIGGSNGVVSPAFAGVGRHSARIIAYDSYNNKAELTFDFLLGPANPLLPLDSIQRAGHDTARFFFTAGTAYTMLKIDSTVVRFNVGKQWFPTTSASFRRLTDNMFMVEVVASGNRAAVLCLVHYSKFGSWIGDYPFNGLVNQAAKAITVEYEFDSDGLLITYHITGPYGSLASVDLYDSTGRVGSVFPSRYFDLQTYRFFVMPKPEYARIDSLVVVMDTAANTSPLKSSPCRIRAVGFSDVDTLAVDSLFQFIVEKGDLFAPRFVELKKLVLPNRSNLKLVTDVYKVLPQDFPTRSEAEVRLTLNIPNSKNAYGGLCRFDFEREKWIWRADSRCENDELTAGSSSGGTFGALLDIYPPMISGLSLTPRQITGDPRPTVSFTVVDTLSGIADDRSFDIRLDRKWMIPEFDPESGVCTFQPPEMLNNGEHHLAIKVTDRAGNLAEQYLIFAVSSREGAKRK
jgi:hypothetical protein